MILAARGTFHSLLQCTSMCKNEYAYTLTFGLHPEDIAINKRIGLKTFHCCFICAAENDQVHVYNYISLKSPETKESINNREKSHLKRK